MEMTVEQQRALAVAAARARAAAAAQNGGVAPAGGKGDFQPMAPGVAKPTQDLPDETSGLESALFGAADMGTGGTVDEISAWLSHVLDGKDYDQALEHARNRMKTAQIEHPIANVGGGVAGAVPIALTGLGVSPAGTGLFGRVAVGGLAGLGQGAVHGYGSGEGDPMNRLVNAATEGGIGSLVGGAIPALGWSVGKLAQALRQMRLPQASDPALFAGRALEREGLTPAAAASALDDLGPQAMLADAGINLQQQAGAIAATPGPGQKLLADTLKARQAGANGRIVSDVDNILGPAPVPSRVDAGIQANQGALSPEYEQALAGARAVDTAPIAEGLDAQAVNLRGPAQKAVQRVRTMLNVAGEDALDPNPRTLLETRKAIDGMLTTEADPNAVRALTAARGQIDDVLANAVPGLKNVDAKFAELARQREALAQGANVLDSGKTAVRPSELIDQVLQAGDSRLPGPSGVPFRLSQGARAEIDRLIGTTSNDLVALQRLVKGEGSWNRDRLATLFGQDKADALLKVLDREKLFSDTNTNVLRNSLTAARQSAQADLGIGAGGAMDPKKGIVRNALNINLGDAATAALDKLTAGLTAARKERVIRDLAGILTAQGPERSAALQELAKTLSASRAGQTVDRVTTGVLTPMSRALVPMLAGH